MTFSTVWQSVHADRWLQPPKAADYVLMEAYAYAHTVVPHVRTRPLVRRHRLAVFVKSPGEHYDPEVHIRQIGRVHLVAH